MHLMAHLSRWLAGECLDARRLRAIDVERFLSARRGAGYTNLTGKAHAADAHVPCAIASQRRFHVAVGNGMLIVVVLGTDVEGCTVTVHIGYGRDAVPIIDETLRRSDPFKD